MHLRGIRRHLSSVVQMGEPTMLQVLPSNRDQALCRKVPAILLHSVLDRVPIILAHAQFLMLVLSLLLETPLDHPFQAKAMDPRLPILYPLI